jgi:hypothetical protein
MLQPTDYEPSFILRIDHRKMLVLKKGTPERDVIEIQLTAVPPNYFNFIIQTVPRSEVVGREICAAVSDELRSVVGKKVVAILYGENKVELLDVNGFVTLKKLEILDWQEVNSEPEKWTLAWLQFLPYSDFILAAKTGETKIIMKNYKDESLDQSILTVFEGISEIILS